MIAGGAALVTEYGWLLYVFAAFLVFNGIKLLFASEKPMDVVGNPDVKWLSRRMTITDELHGAKVFARGPDTKTGQIVIAAAPLLLAHVVLKIAPLAFTVARWPRIFR